MLSYQHIYHAGNLADVHKHMMLVAMLDYLTRKDKPLSYIETHAGRGLYDLADDAARKTGEADAGIEKVLARLDPQMPYRHVIESLRRKHGPHAYPGSPLIAAELLRPQDSIHLAELHPQEHAALMAAMQGSRARCHARDGFDLAVSLCPPTPRRGLLFIDPSWEVKADYIQVPRHMSRIAKLWNVGIIALWYPILTSSAHDKMLETLENAHPEGLRHEVRFPPARDGHKMVGSGFFVTHPPYGLAQFAAEISRLFAEWFPDR
jgi:23S rRNA (adenine2030-N6)-methyltransferase